MQLEILLKESGLDFRVLWSHKLFDHGLASSLASHQEPQKKTFVYILVHAKSGFIPKRVPCSQMPKSEFYDMESAMGASTRQLC